MRFVDLFAGIGGFHLALSDPEIGGTCVLAVEQDPDCERVYRRAWPETPFVRDVRSVTLRPDGTERTPEEIDKLVPDHDMLCAGFPCQPFSKSGPQLGVRDRTRGTLFHDIMLIIRAKRPRFIMLENVRNLAGPRHRRTWLTIIDALHDAGYCVADEPLVVSPHNLPPELGGAPQVRDRVFILGHRLTPPYHPWEVHGEPLLAPGPVDGWDPHRWRIEDHLDPDEEIPFLERYRLRDVEIGWIEAWQALAQDIPDDDLPGFPLWADAFVVDPEIPSGTPRWKRAFLEKNSGFYRTHRRVIDRWRQRRYGPLKQTIDEFPASRRKFEWQARAWQPARADRDLWQLVLHLRPSGIRVKPPTYLPALVAITQTSIIGSRRRRITPREAARLQGVPPDHITRAEVSDAAAYRQLGNAVNVGVVKLLARTLVGHVERREMTAAAS